MDNEFTRRLEKEGLRGISKFLQAILQTLKDIQEELADMKRKTKPEPKA